MANILIVEDEQSINELLYRNMTLVGHECLRAYDGKEAFSLLEKGNIDIVLLDIMLSEIDGLSVMKNRPDKEVPVILITAKNDLNDKIKGLDMGADDYIIKPFEMPEVMARVRAVLRRMKKDETVFSIDHTKIDLSSRKATYKGKQVELTFQEFALIEALIVNRNLALSREKLLQIAWGYDYTGDTRTVDVHIQKVRKKLGLSERIKTVFKYGYRLEIRE